MAYPLTSLPAKPYRRLIYRSRIAIEMTPLILTSLVETSIYNNLRDSITGMLLYGDEQFVQFLEGPPRQITQCMDRIAADPRHEALEILQDGPADERVVPNWAMKLLHEYPHGSASVGHYDLTDYMQQAA